MIAASTALLGHGRDRRPALGERHGERQLGDHAVARRGDGAEEIAVQRALRRPERLQVGHHPGAPAGRRRGAARCRRPGRRRAPPPRGPPRWARARRGAGAKRAVLMGSPLTKMRAVRWIDQAGDGGDLLHQGGGAMGARQPEAHRGARRGALRGSISVSVKVKSAWGGPSPTGSTARCSAAPVVVETTSRRGAISSAERKPMPCSPMVSGRPPCRCGRGPGDPRSARRGSSRGRGR